MEIAYDDKRVASLFQNFDEMKRKHGIKMTREIKKIYDILEASVNFAEFIRLSVGNPHPLKGDKKGLYAVKIDKNKRLILKPITKDGDLSPNSLEKCEKVIIKGVKDYHGRKSTTYIP